MKTSRSYIVERHLPGITGKQLGAAAARRLPMP
jgi:hypothetical protein